MILGKEKFFYDSSIIKENINKGCHIKIKTAKQEQIRLYKQS